MDGERKLADFLTSYLKYTHNTEPARSFRLFSGISVIASALQRKCYMNHGLTPLYPNLYMVLVAPPGKGRKSTALNPARDLITSANIRIAPNTTTREGLIKTISESNSLIALQHEELYKRMYINHTSLTVFSGEFGVFLGESSLMVQDLTDMFDCPNVWEYNTKTDELKVYIENLWLNIMGATTPKYIRQMFNRTDLVGGGLSSRIIFIYEDDKEKTIPLPIMSKEEKQLRKDLIHDLKLIKNMSGEFKFTNEFVELYVEWYKGLDAEDSVLKHEAYKEYESRRQIHLLKLTMIFSASRSDEMILREVDFNKALKELEAVEAKMYKVFLGVGELKEAKVLAEILAAVESAGEVKVYDLMNVFLYDLDLETLKRLLRDLRVSNKVKIVDPKVPNYTIRSLNYEDKG